MAVGVGPAGGGLGDGEHKAARAREEEKKRKRKREERGERAEQREGGGWLTVDHLHAKQRAGAPRANPAGWVRVGFACVFF